MDAGDIIAICGTGWLADRIRKATGGPVSHVGILVSPEYPALIIEALTQVTTSTLASCTARAQAAWILECKTLTPIQRQQIVECATSFSCDSYGYYKIGLQYANAVFGTRWFTEHLNQDSSHPICSQLVADSYLAAGLNFGVSAGSITPFDIWNFALSNPPKFDIVRVK